ncbi:MAG: hypothetical protein J1E64_05170 [Acetatifactor sp.]|nr:hypothetical protein [Acetatifactor sp.]
MFRIFQEEKVITICMLTFFGVSVLTRMLLAILYQNMIRETENMATTNNKLLKKCKLKFANCYQLNNGVANIPVFVDKFLSRLSLGPLSFESLYHLSGQLMLLSVVFAGIGICKCIMEGRMLGEILPFYIASFLGLYLYFSLSTLLDVKGRRRNLKINLVDYLENHLSSRIGVTEADMEMLYGSGTYGPARSRRNAHAGKGKRTVELMPIGGRAQIVGNINLQERNRDKSDNVREIVSPDIDSVPENVPVTFTSAQEKELEQLLKEFLTL